MQWTNQKTGDIEELESIPDDRWPEFIPQDETCQMLYRRYVNHKGMVPKDAAFVVMARSIGRKDLCD